MPQEPKKRHSRARQGKRRAHIKLSTPQTTVCPNCDNMHESHTICPRCGYYKRKQYIAIKQQKAQVSQHENLK
ncbi:MAG: 50S ribosomal protein L32 [Candidatus Levybacteria bacterium]|nr:50S ribosomal protein L32 [Candidatus Levybacteria bacterium]